MTKCSIFFHTTQWLFVIFFLTVLIEPASAAPSLQKVVQDYSQINFEIVDFSERTYKGAASLGLVLSVPLDSQLDFQQYLVLERRDGEKVDGAWILSENGKELFFKNIEPETEYLLTVYSNIKAFNNKSLAQRFKQNITTRAMKASIGFAHKGGILPLTQSRGIPIFSINIKQVDIEFHRVKPEEMSNFLQYWRGGKESHYRIQDYAEKAEFVYSARFELDIEKNKRERIILPIDHIDELKPAGIYFAVMKAAGYYDYQQSISYFIRSDIGVHVRRYPGQLNAYVRSLVSAEALPDVSISLLDEKGHLLVKKKSDRNGFVQFNDSLNKAHLLLAEGSLLAESSLLAEGSLFADGSAANKSSQQQISLLYLNSPALDLSEFNIGQQIQHQNEAFFYSPRDLYRPGGSVDISLLLRNQDGRRIPDIPLKAEIKRADGQVMEYFTWYAAKPGYYHHQYQLSDNARTGKWSIELSLPGDKQPRQWFFSVEDFLPERLKLSLQKQAESQYLDAAELLAITVDGQYLYGAPASGNRLETRINTFIKQEAIESLPGYLFGLTEELELENEYYLKDLQLDKEGKAKIEIPSTWNKVQSPIVIRVSSSLFETGGRAVKRQVKYKVWPAETLIGIYPHEQEPQQDSLVSFDVINADQSGNLHKADNLKVKLIRKRRDYVWKYNQSDEWEMDYSERQYAVYQQAVSINKGTKKQIDVPVEWGEYRLEITNPETNFTTSVDFNAGGSWYSNNQYAKVARPDKINLTLDKPGYKPDDIARLSITSPFRGRGLVLIENNNNLLSQQNIELLDSNELKIMIPIPDAADKNTSQQEKEAWNRHDIYISVVLFNAPDIQLNTHSEQQEASVNKTSDLTADLKGQTIKRAIGLLHLPLDRSDRQLDISIESTEKSKPDTTLPIHIKLDNITEITDKEIMLTVAAVDVGVLNVSDFITPDPFAWFFAQRRYAVDSLDLYGNIIDGRSGIIGRQRFGGDMDLASAGDLPKARVKIVSLFHQAVFFNEAGEARLELQIPDFNGQLRIMAIAFGDSSFGSAEKDITIAAPMVTQLSIPRFMSANDETQFTLDIHNLTDQEQVLNINLTAENHGTDNPGHLRHKDIEIIEPSREINLAGQIKKTLHFKVKSHSGFGLSDVILNIKNQSQSTDKINVLRKWQLAVRPAYPAVLRNDRQMIAKDQKITLKTNTDDLIEETLQGELLISNQPPINIASHLEHLLNYPYGCLEQSVSSSFPWLFADKMKVDKLGLQDLKIEGEVIDFSQRKKYLARGIQKIAAKQLANGGFGLWDNNSYEELWLSAYAAHFLLQSKEQGADVPRDVLKSALQRLQKYLRSTRPAYNYRYSRFPEHLTLAYKAYAAYVLSSISRAPLGTMRTLYDYHKKDARSGLPLMHLGIALYRQGDLKRGKQSILEAIEVIRDEQAYLGDYGSKLRDLSLMLEALIYFEPAHPGIGSLLYRLQDELIKRQWLSTQERNALFMAGVALKNNNQKEWQAILLRSFDPGVQSDGSAEHNLVKEQKITHRGDFKLNTNRDDMLEGFNISSLNNERLFASLNVSGYTKIPPAPDFEHFNITRTYYNTKGEMIIPQQVSVGELIIVELSLQSKNRIQDALVVDLLPAGFEIENQHLAHSIKLDDYRIGDKAIIEKMSAYDIKYQAYRDDRYVAAIDIAGHTTQRLYYLLRAVTPGIYQIPPPYAEDMYRPYIRAVGETPEAQTIVNHKL